MRCAEILPSLPAFVLGGLESEEAVEVRRHLASCPRCQEGAFFFSRGSC
jgi:anti-sigma factor RsiW